MFEIVVGTQSVRAGCLRDAVQNSTGFRSVLCSRDLPVLFPHTELFDAPFTIGRKNWVLIHSVRGARASAVIYSLADTARLNGLNVYRYMKHLLTELPKLADDKGNIDTEKLEPLLPWPDQLPAQCQKPRR